MPPNQGRTKRVHMVMTPDEWSMAVALAERRGLTVSDVVRLHIRESYEREFGSAQATKAKPKRKK